MAYKRSRKAFEADLQRQESPYVFIGTPLPPLDERINDDGSFVPLWKQEVTDDRGRKRLHGAFTGGYSAGYFNTVGSKEGWAPSNFVSSRNKGANDQQPRQQRVEDFMDDEDLREAEESRSLQTSEAFAGFGDTTAASRETTLIDIFRPSGETVGAKLLKRMGWKEGHGIGPRIKRAADLGEGQFSKDQTHTFAPADIPVLALSQNTDRKGLGFDSTDPSVETKFGQATRSTLNPSFEPGDEDEDLSRGALSLFKPSQASRTRKGGFGVGVLNDTGSDEEDPYSMGPRISYNKSIGGDKPGRKDKKKLVANPSLRQKPALLPQKLHGLQSASRKCHDGRPPLDGFVLGDQIDAMSKLSLTKDKYRPPEVPAGWVSKLAPTGTEHEESTFISTSDAAKSSDHNAKTRASMLGEKLLPGKSVFDYLSPTTRDRLAVATGNPNLPAGLGEAPSASEGARGIRRDLTDLVPYLDRSAALQALSRSSESSTSWMPYAEDLDKRERYKSFLEIKARLTLEDAASDLPPRAPGMSQADWVNEMNEFARAAEVFKPISGLMANRFTSSSSANAVQEGTDVDSGTLLTYKRNKPEDPAESAAKMGMFGQMTRSVTSFYPTRMICKRFGVAMPDLSDPPAGQNPTPAAPSRQDLFPNVGKFQSAGYQNNEKSEPGPPSAAEKAASTASTDANATGGGPAYSNRGVNPDRNEVLEQEKPGMALFKSIFGSDDEDEDD